MELENTEERKPKRMLGLIFLAIGIGAAVNVIIGLFQERADMLKAIESVRIWQLAIPFACYFGGYLIDSVRLSVILRHCGYKIHPWEAFYNSVLGVFISNLTPSSAGGQPFQISHLSSLGVPVRTATNIILSRFVVNAMILMAIILASIPVLSQIAANFTAGAIVMYVGLASTFAFSMVFLLVLVKPGIISGIAHFVSRTFINRLIVRLSKRADWLNALHEWVTELRADIHFLWKQKLSAMILDILLNILAIGLQGLSMYYILTNTMNLPDLNFFQVLVIFVLVWQVVFYVPTPGASGTLEGGFAAVYAGITGSLPATLVAVVIWRFATYYLHVFIGLGAFTVYSRIKKFPVIVLEKVSDETSAS